MYKNATYLLATVGDVTKPSPGRREGGGQLDHRPTARAGPRVTGAVSTVNLHEVVLTLFMLKHGFCHL